MSVELGETTGPWDAADLAGYGLTPPLTIAPLVGAAGINNQARAVTTGAGRFLWKAYLTHADPAPIRAEHRLLGWLAGAGLPFGTPTPVPDASGETLRPAPGGHGWRALFRWLPGDQPDRRDPATIAALGAALGLLHGALARLPAPLAPSLRAFGEPGAVHPLIPDPYNLTPTALGLPEIAPYVEQLASWREVMAAIDAFLAGPYRALPRQVIHGDFGPGNALALDDRITAILDFEFALRDARAIDLASGLGLTIRIWQFDPPESLALAAALCRGYARTAGLTAAEVAALPDLVILREVIGAIWWLGRARAVGNARLQVERLADLHALIAWLRAHDGAFREAVSAAVVQASQEASVCGNTRRC